MVDITAISALISSAKNMVDILTKGNSNTPSDIAIKLQSELVSMQSHALTAQTEQLNLIERIHKLEEENTKLKNWETEQQKYELTELRPKVYAYHLKDNESSSEPVHHICPDCYSQQKKSILQKEYLDHGDTEALVCHHCKLQLILSGSRAGEQINLDGFI